MLDFEKEFSEFTDNGSSVSSIREIYSLIPTLTQDQVEIYMQLTYFINEYQLHELKQVLNEYMLVQAKNKNLSFTKNTTLKNLMKAYSLEEQMRGIKINRNTSEE